MTRTAFYYDNRSNLRAVLDPDNGLTYYTYDSLNRLATFARGTLEDSNSDGIPDAIDGTPSAQQTFTMDALGNMATDPSRP